MCALPDTVVTIQWLGYRSDSNSSSLMFIRNVGSYKSHEVSRPKDGILHSHRRENLRSYIALTGWTL
jgi:hypothetical protein